MTFIDQHCTPRLAAREGGSDGKTGRSAGYFPCDRSIASGDNQQVSLRNLQCDKVSVETNSGARIISLPVYRGDSAFQAATCSLAAVAQSPVETIC